MFAAKNIKSEIFIEFSVNNTKAVIRNCNYDNYDKINEILSTKAF